MLYNPDCMGTGKKEICKKLNGRWNKEQVSCVMKVPVFLSAKIQILKNSPVLCKIC